MGSLATNFSAFLFLVPIGIRRLLCSFSLYLKNPSQYRSKPWYLSEPRWKNFDLYILLFSLPIASFSDIFLFLTFSGHPTYKFAFFQQSILLCVFWILLILISLREYFDLLINESFLFVFAAIAFLLENSVTNRGFDNGPAGRVYDLLSGLTLICSFSCFYLSCKPCAFWAEVCLSLGLVFKGTWVLQGGLNLYTDAFSLKGCQRVSLSDKKIDLLCDVEEDGYRGVALINFLFVAHAMLVMVMHFVLFGVLNCQMSMRIGKGGVGGSLMSEIESQSLLLHPLSDEFEIE